MHAAVLAGVQIELLIGPGSVRLILLAVSVKLLQWRIAVFTS